ncbi:DUF806 family protein [Lactococcus lactis]|uniref:DUF806 family protein n=1 Tax=Lactococcus lactis TaxID=1358 RepID=UPI002659B70B|nr:DUF806 family protein [Lactococcus lactis]WKG35967.1 DUF806 family protein [Lactococcus lactis subsp. lactis]
MKRPVEIVQDIIAASDFPYSEIFLDSIPSEKLDSSNETQVLLTESDNGPSDYGNSEFVSLLYGVYIQIFYSNAEDSDINVVQSEINLMKSFINNDWLIAQSKSHYIDPDTGQIIKNLTVQRIMTLSEIANS